MNLTDRAKVLLSDDFFMSVVKKQQELYTSNIFNSAEGDFDFRERSLVKFKAIEELLASIQAIADDKQIQTKKWKIL